MHCLHCGDCCKRMSPLSEETCKHLVEVKGYFLCSAYRNRPERCKKHEYPHRFCPVGVDVLKLADVDKVRYRIDHGWELCQRLFGEAPDAD